MALKIFRAVWFFSVSIILGVLLYHYAGWPEQIVIGQETINFITLGRDLFFYVSLAILVFINVTVYIVRSLAHRAVNLQAWFYGLIAIINFFLVIALSAISLFNSNENYRFGQLGVIIYGSMVLIGLWLLGGVLYWLVSKVKPVSAA
jgi:hypothetical protein